MRNDAITRRQECWQHLFRPPEVLLWILANVRKELRQRALEPNRLLNSRQLGGNFPHLGQPQLVNVLGCHIGGRVIFHIVPIEVFATWQGAKAAVCLACGAYSWDRKSYNR